MIPADDRQKGFTLIELMIGMAIGLVILSGLTMMFVSTNSANSAAASRTERMSDLYLASHIMQAGLRESLSAPDAAQSVLTNLSNRSVSKPTGYPSNDATFASLPYWDATSKTLTYQDLEGNVGIFQYQRTSNDRIYWLRPLAAGVSGSATFQELMRDMNTSTGMSVSISGNTVTVSLTGAFKNESKQSAPISLTFKTWPRN